MISYYGVSNPTLQKAIIELCFYGNDFGIDIIDSAIVNDELSGEQLRMLPMIFTKVKINGFSTYTQSRIKGMYKHTLCRNHSLLGEALKFQKLLNATGYKKIIFLKGVATLLYARKNLGQRPMADIDILIPDFIDDIQKSTAFIKKEEYVIKSFGAREISVLDKNKNEFDIHWLLNHGALKKTTVDKMLANAITIQYQGSDILVPCYEHQLGHLFVHGIFAPTLTFDGRWIVDVIDLLSLNKKINPDIFLDFVGDFTLPSKIKFAINLILENAGHKLQFDRESLVEVSNRIQSKNHLLAYFYNQKPMPNLPFIEDKKRYSWIKSGICTHIIEPLIVARHNKVPFLKALGLTLGFPPPPMGKILLLLLEKIYQRIFHRISTCIKSGWVHE